MYKYWGEIGKLIGKIGKVRKIFRSKRLILTVSLGKKSPDAPLTLIITQPAHCFKVIKFHSFTFSRAQTFHAMMAMRCT